jgi:hypothetical protein
MNSIVFAGNILNDVVKTIPTWPEKGRLVQITSLTRAVGGSVCNTGVDLKTLDELHESGELDDDAYEDLEHWLSGDIERVYRDYRDVCEAVRLVDRHMDLNLLPRMEAVFKHEDVSKLPIPIDVVERNLENMPQFGEMSR